MTPILVLFHSRHQTAGATQQAQTPDAWPQVYPLDFEGNVKQMSLVSEAAEGSLYLPSAGKLPQPLQ